MADSPPPSSTKIPPSGSETTTTTNNSCSPKSTLSSCRLIHHGSSASSYSHSLLWLRSGIKKEVEEQGDDDAVLVYSSHGIINIAQLVLTRWGKLMHVTETLRTNESTFGDGGGGSVITALASAGTVVNVDEYIAKEELGRSRIRRRRRIVSAFSDGTLNLWTEEEAEDGRDNGSVVGVQQRWKETVLLTGGGGTSVTDVAALSLASNNDRSGGGGGISDDNDGNEDGLVVVTGSADGTLLQSFPSPSSSSAEQKRNMQKIGTSSVSSVSVVRNSHPNDDEILIFVGTANPRHNRIYVYTAPISADGGSRGNTTKKDDDSANGARADAVVGDAICHGGLVGHQDWITCLDWKCGGPPVHGGGGTSVGGGGAPAMLASGSKDCKIRLWKFHPSTTTPTNGDDDGSVPGAAAVRAESFGGDYDDEDDDDEENVDDLLEEEGEARLQLHHRNHTVTNVTLEALLIGHDEPVTSVTWHPNTEEECLLSSSLDKSILLWKPEKIVTSDDGDKDEEEAKGGGGGGTGVWTPLTRVGTAGGILGGSIGSSLLGFVDATFHPHGGTRIVGMGYGGSLHFWSAEAEKEGVSEEEEGQDLVTRWKADPCLTGHFGPVSDLAWEANGEYLLSVGGDQTCRLWAEVPTAAFKTTSEKRSVVWTEVGRPQVHGYDLTTVTSIGSSGGGESIEPRHRFVSGADEKELRCFDAPLETLRLLRSLRRGDDDGGEAIDNAENDGMVVERVERAYLPSLGLSNRATASEDADEEVVDAMMVGGDAVTSVEQSKTMRLPLERDLGVTTLWPEVRKLYGHNTELVCVTSTTTASSSSFASTARVGGGGGGKPKVDTTKEEEEEAAAVVVASACKARDVNDASIRLWVVNKGICTDVLRGGHRSTVATLAFSPDGRYLASSGKDRRLCIWRRTTTRRRRRRRPHEESANAEVASKEVDSASAAPAAAATTTPSQTATRTMNDQTTTPPTPMFELVSAIDSAHRRIVWSVHFCPILDRSILASGARDGFVKIWSVVEKDSGDGEEEEEEVNGNDDENVPSVQTNELFKFEPSASQTSGKKGEAVTAVSFAPKPIMRSQEKASSLSLDGPEQTDGILAVGLESGLIELWAIPLDGGGGSNCQFLSAIPPSYCHIGTVKKLSWRPPTLSSGEKDTERNRSLETRVDLTLASCGIDHGVRIFDLSL